MKKYSIGIDIGASHIGIGIVDTKLKKIIIKKYFLYECKENEQKFINELSKSIEEIIKMSNLKTSDIIKIGIGCPGDCDLEKGVLVKAPNLNLNNIPIKQVVEEQFNIKTFIENDATCALLGEFYFGNLKEKKNGIMIVVGTGIGFAGFLCKNEIETFDIQYCNSLSNIFKDGYSNRTFNSGSFKYLQDAYIHNLKENNTNYENIDRKKIFEDVLLKNEVAENTLNLYLAEFAKGVKNLNNKTGIKTFCIGGGISEYSQIFEDSLKERLPDIDLTFAKHQNDSAIIGASLLE